MVVLLNKNNILVINIIYQIYHPIQNFDFHIKKK